MPERVATADSDFDNEGSVREFLSRALGRYPRDMLAIVVAIGAAGTILTNALYRQPGPHPAPIFSIMSRPVAAEPADIVPVSPRKAETVAKVDVPAPRPRVEAVKADPVPVKAEPAKAPQKTDPIAALIGGGHAPAAAAAPTPKVMMVQRALNDFGYGPVKATGSLGPDTTAAIQKFERERKLPVTGQISPRFLKELTAATGRPME